MRKIIVLSAILAFSVASADAATKHRALHRTAVLLAYPGVTVVTTTPVSQPNSNWDYVLDRPKSQNDGGN
jgi:hypothetical protein